MKLSLNGLRILNTRPEKQAKKLSRTIRDAGGIAIELPALEIKATHNNWINALPDLNTIDQAIFISANAVEHCFTQLQQHHIQWPSTIHVIAIGRGSAAALGQWNIRVDSIPEASDSEHLLALHTLQEPQNQRILLFKGDGGRPLIEESLLLKKVKLLTLNVYQRAVPKISAQFVKSIWRDDLVDIILLTSEQSMLNLFELFGNDALSWLRNKTCLVISERLAQIATSLGIKNIIVSHHDQMMNTLFDYLTKD